MATTKPAATLPPRVALSDLLPPTEYGSLWVTAAPYGGDADDAADLINSAPPAWFLPGLSHPDAAAALEAAHEADRALREATAAADAARDADAHLLAAGSGKAKREAEARQVPYTDATRAARRERNRAWRHAAALVGKPGEEVTAARRAVLADALPAAHEAAVQALDALHMALLIRSGATQALYPRPGIYRPDTKHTDRFSELRRVVTGYEVPTMPEAAE